jgi:3-methyladenine DNA glycosylase AlkD
MTRSAAARQEVCRTVFNEVRAFCVANSDEARARRYARYFTEGYDAYGLDYRNPGWEENRIRWTEMLREAGPKAFLDAGDLLVATGKYEEASFAIVIARGLRDTFTPEAFSRIGKWFEGGIRNWGHTDVLSGELLSLFLLDGIVDLDALAAWRDSPYKYKRRAVPVTMIKLLDGAAPIAGMLKAVEPLMHDPERVVQQGMGWFLREVWKRQPKPVEQLLLKHKDSCARLIVQYATEKMSKEARLRFRKTR